MKRFAALLALLVGSGFSASDALAEGHARLVITTHMPEGNGLVYLSIYRDAQGFPDQPKAAVHALKIPVKNGVAQTAVQLPKGTYAIGAFYDADANGELTKNIFGAPAEPYGFSNKARSRFRAPRFSEAAFTISGPHASVSLELK